MSSFASAIDFCILVEEGRGEGRGGEEGGGRREGGGGRRGGGRREEGGGRRREQRNKYFLIYNRQRKKRCSIQQNNKQIILNFIFYPCKNFTKPLQSSPQSLFILTLILTYA